MNKVDSICIIDDDPIFVFGARRLIELADICNTFLIFKNGREAIENLRPKIEEQQNIPDIILLDLNMPIMDGWQFLDEFVKIKSGKPITIYIVSSSIDPKDREKVKNYEVVSNYIIKPISQKAIEQIKFEVLS